MLKLKHNTMLGCGVGGVAVLSAVLLSSTMFQDYPLVLDEHGSYWLLESDIPSSLVQRSLDYAAIPPLSAWAQQLSTLIFGKSEFAFRFPSMLAFCLGVVVLIACGSRTVDPVTGGLAGLLLAWNPLVLNEIRFARCYGLVVLLAACLLWITVVWWKDGNNWQLAVAFALFSVLLAWTHYLALLFACVCGAALVVLPRKPLGEETVSHRPPPTLVVLVVMVCGLLCLPLLPSLERLRNWSVLMELQSQAPSLFAVIGPVWIAGIPAVLIVAWLLARFMHSGQNLRSVSRRSAIAVSGFVAAASLVIFIAFAVIGPQSVGANPRYQVAFTTALSLALAAVIRSVTSKTGRPELASFVSVGVAIVASWMMAGKSPIVPDRLDVAAAEWQRAAAIVADGSGSHDLVFVQSGLVESALVPQLFQDELFMEYVACRLGKFYLPQSRERVALPFFWTGYIEMTANFRQKLFRRRSSGAAVWVAAATDTDPTLGSLVGMRNLLVVEGWTLDTSWPMTQMTLEQYRFDRPVTD